MLIVMKSDATDSQIETVLRVIEQLGFKGHPMPGATRTAIGITGNQGAVDPSHFENLAGVAEAIRVSKPYKLISLDLRPEKTIVRVGGDATIGGDELAIIAGPCAIESRAQAFAVAEAVRRSGARFFRGGAYKPRTSPYAFQGLGEEGLRILADIRDAYGLKIVTEALDESGVDLVEKYGDMIQIGARNMQNYSLLRAVGRMDKPVLLKRGMAATITDLLLSAEYILAEGNGQVILCERGIRSFDTMTRNLFDLTAIPIVQRLSHLPMIADPSHGTGLRDKVIPMARAAVAAGADGVIVEVHPTPDRALSDGGQSLYPDQFARLVTELRAIASAIGRPLAAPAGTAVAAGV